MPEPRYYNTIDIGSHQIALARSAVFPDGRVELVDIVLSPSRGVDQGYVNDIAKATESFKHAQLRFEQKTKQKFTQAMISIGGADLSSQYVKTSIELRRPGTEISNRDLVEVADKAELLYGEKYPNKKVLHVIPTTYRVDDKDVLGNPVGMIGTILEAKVLVITTSEHHAESLLRVTEESGVSIDDLVAAPIADAASCLTYNQKKQGCVLVNVGAETTQISTYEHGKLTSIRVAGLGSTDITNDLALGLQISIEEAEEVKRGKSNNHPQKKVREIIDARLIDIVETVERHLRSIKKNRLLPAGVVWTGDGSLIPELDDIARSVLHIPSTKPSFELSLEDKKRKIKIGPKISTAFGLAHTSDGEPTVRPSLTLDDVKKRIGYWLSQLRP